MIIFQLLLFNCMMCITGYICIFIIKDIHFLCLFFSCINGIISISFHFYFPSYHLLLSMLSHHLFSLYPHICSFFLRKTKFQTILHHFTSDFRFLCFSRVNNFLSLMLNSHQNVERFYYKVMKYNFSQCQFQRKIFAQKTQHKS